MLLILGTDEDKDFLNKIMEETKCATKTPSQHSRGINDIMKLLSQESKIKSTNQFCNPMNSQITNTEHHILMS